MNDEVPVHRTTRSIRTYKPRRGRVTERQARGIAVGSAYLLDPEMPVVEQWRPSGDLVMEIGFGTGDSVAMMALADPQTSILAVDIHTPGIGDLLARIVDDGLSNIRVISGDALDVLGSGLEKDSLLGVRLFFPDPWPKMRHHKRRLVSAENVDLIASRVRPGGFWHLATDWAPYADWMRRILDASPMWRGGEIDRPRSRPITRYERIAISQGRKVVDLLYTRTTTRADRGSPPSSLSTSATPTRTGDPDLDTPDR